MTGSTPAREHTVSALLEQSVSVLERAGVPDPQIDAELLIGHVIGASRGRVQALAVTQAPIGGPDTVAVIEAVERRAHREPLQHITGVAWFRSLELSVGPGVFVPRPETELLAGFAIDTIRSIPFAQGAEDGPIAVDLGTGSGAIALAIATEVPHARVFAVEKSTEAHSWAQRNFSSSGAHNATLVQGDLATAFDDLNGLVSVVASNPPYIPVAAVPRDVEVRLYDPALALYGGDDGLDVVRLVSQTAQRLLHTGGSLFIEHGELQGEQIRDLLNADGWHATATHRDLTTRDRFTSAIR